MVHARHAGGDYWQRRRGTAWAIDGELPSGIEESVGGREPLEPERLYRFVSGVDPAPRLMSGTQLDGLRDPMARTFFARGSFPLTVGAVMAEFDAAGTLPTVSSYLVGEAGQIAPEDAGDLVRDFRFAIVRQQGANADLLISTSATDPTVGSFLQVAAWDELAGRFNYYMRVDEAWVWSGDSFTALEPASRGRACFDSHMNGSLVMKELAQPWLHWQSMNAGIRLAPDSPVRKSPYFRSPPLRGAEHLERIVRASVDRWTTARMKQVSAGGLLQHPDWLVRQLCTTTTVNLASSPVEFRALDRDEHFSPPIGLWLNADALLDVLAVPADVEVPAMKGGDYLDAVSRFGFELREGAWSQSGDSYFAFAVPVPATEDNNVVAHLVSDGVLSAKFAACVLMVDFANPIFSARRAALGAYCPTGTFELAAPGGLSEAIATAITGAAAGTGPDSPEAEFAAIWAVPDDEWPDVFAGRLAEYFRAIESRIGTAGGVDDYVRLAESRRRQFKTLSLHEFNLTLPVTNIPAGAPLLDMTPDARVVPAVDPDRAMATPQPLRFSSKGH